MAEQLLILFVKSPVPGKVKTRLAAEIGEENACLVYRWLLTEIHEAVVGLNIDKVVYYDERIENGDGWEEEFFEKEVQSGRNIGEKMENAFRQSFVKGYQKVVLAGSDIAGLTADIIGKAFASLDDNDIVLGPANDGGYYLIGMSGLHEELFSGINWSTPTVLEETVSRVGKLKLDYILVDELIDIDVLSDLRLVPHLYNKLSNEEKK